MLRLFRHSTLILHTFNMFSQRLIIRSQHIARALVRSSVSLRLLKLTLQTCDEIELLGELLLKISDGCESFGGAISPPGNDVI